jgi:hypothetical protein
MNPPGMAKTATTKAVSSVVASNRRKLDLRRAGGVAVVALLGGFIVGGWNSRGCDADSPEPFRRIKGTTAVVVDPAAAVAWPGLTQPRR